MKKKLKICSPQLGLNPNSDLGGEVHDYFVLQGLANKGHKIFVYLPKGIPHQKDRNIKVERALIRHIPAISFNILILPYLFRTYRKEEFDILRVHNPYFVGIGAFIFKMFHSKVKIVTTYHLVERNMIFNIINFLTIKKYDKIFTVSKFVKNWLSKTYSLQTDKVYVIYNGVSPALKPIRKNVELLKKYNLDDKFTLLFMGLLINRKNPLFILKVFKTLKEKNQNLALLICGAGPLETKIRAYIRSNKLNDVILTGTVFGKNKIDHFNLSDVLVLPSKNEGFGLVVAEAMACAKPTIVSNNSSLKEIVSNGKDGFVCDIKSEKKWIEKISLLMNDKILKEEMGKAAHKKANEQFSWDTIINNYTQVFSNIIKDVN